MVENDELIENIISKLKNELYQESDDLEVKNRAISGLADSVCRDREDMISQFKEKIDKLQESIDNLKKFPK